MHQSLHSQSCACARVFRRLLVLLRLPRFALTAFNPGTSSRPSNLSSIYAGPLLFFLVVFLGIRVPSLRVETHIQLAVSHFLPEPRESGQRQV